MKYIYTAAFSRFIHPQGGNSLPLACNRLCDLPVPEYREHIKQQLIRHYIELFIPVNDEVWKFLIRQAGLLSDRFAIDGQLLVVLGMVYRFRGPGSLFGGLR